MQVEFLIHVTLPPDYDSEKTYPLMLLTDGVWRFGNVPELRKCMENGEAASVILVTLGYEYHIDGTNEYYRFTHMVEQRDLLLDFITDNLMPYLCEQYHIDCESSTLYGHSDGGVFAHNALFNSDKYENQPFGRYIIGSPAFFGLYDEDLDDLRPEEALNDYGYFDRHETLDKRVWLCGGAQEDPDYEQLYRGHDTTLEGLAHLRDRIEAHHGDDFYKLYESHHYQYIPEMLVEYLKTEYPV
jgi:predicted alpha/beta superfamily hydrolase